MLQNRGVVAVVVTLTWLLLSSLLLVADKCNGYAVGTMLMITWVLSVWWSVCLFVVRLMKFLATSFGSGSRVFVMTDPHSHGWSSSLSRFIGKLSAHVVNSSDSIISISWHWRYCETAVGRIRLSLLLIQHNRCATYLHRCFKIAASLYIYIYPIMASSKRGI